MLGSKKGVESIGASRFNGFSPFKFAPRDSRANRASRANEQGKTFSRSETFFICIFARGTATSLSAEKLVDRNGSDWLVMLLTSLVASVICSRSRESIRGVIFRLPPSSVIIHTYLLRVSLFRLSSRESRDMLDFLLVQVPLLLPVASCLFNKLSSC